MNDIDATALAKALAQRERDCKQAEAWLWEDGRDVHGAIRSQAKAQAFAEALELLASWCQGKLGPGEAEGQLAMPVAGHPDHACGYGDCPVWCANRKDVCLCSHEPVAHGETRGCLRLGCKCPRPRSEVEAMLEQRKTWKEQAGG